MWRIELGCTQGESDWVKEEEGKEGIKKVYGIREGRKRGEGGGAQTRGS